MIINKIVEFFLNFFRFILDLLPDIELVEIDLTPLRYIVEYLTYFLPLPMITFITQFFIVTTGIYIFMSVVSFVIRIIPLPSKI